MSKQNQWCMWRAQQLRKDGQDSLAAMWEERSVTEPAPDPAFVWPTGYDRDTAVAVAQEVLPGMPDDASDFWVLGALNTRLDSKGGGIGGAGHGNPNHASDGKFASGGGTHHGGGAGRGAGGAGGGGGAGGKKERAPAAWQVKQAKAEGHAGPGTSSKAHAASAHAEQHGGHEAHAAAHSAHSAAASEARASGDHGKAGVHDAMSGYHKTQMQPAAHPAASNEAPHGYSAGPGRVVAHSTAAPSRGEANAQSQAAMEMSQKMHNTAAGPHGVRGTAAEHENAAYTHKAVAESYDRLGDKASATMHREIMSDHFGSGEYIGLHGAAAAASAHADKSKDIEAHYAATDAHQKAARKAKDTNEPRFRDRIAHHEAEAKRHADTAWELKPARDKVPSMYR